MATRPNASGIRNWNGSATWRDITYNLISGNGAWPLTLDQDDQISPSTDQIRIQRNIIGFNRTVTALMRNGGDGIAFAPGSIANVLIGGTASSDGNIITANDDGIDLRSVSGITIQGNTIALAVSRGIWLDNVRAVTIGGASGRNVIAGNRRRGIYGFGTNSAITINGNFIGTDLKGNLAVTNGQSEGAVTKDAISFDSGGTVANLAILNNVIGGYGAALVELWSSTTNTVTIQGNNIGIGADGTSQTVSGNIEDLIYVGGGSSHSNLLIGGSAPGQGNAIAFSSRSGIRLESTGSNIQVIGNTIRNNTRNGIYLTGNTRAAIIGNRLSGNGLIGIDLGENGVTANDTGDGDSGANDLLNFPVISAANTDGGNQLIYSFTLDAPAAANGYRIDFFASSVTHATGFGEGERFLGSVGISHAGGSRSFSGILTTLEPITVDSRITATASRRTAGGTWDITSEFSAAATASDMAQLSVAMTSAPLTGSPEGPFATPGNDMVLSTTVSNVGSGSTSADSIFVVLSIDSANSFLNAVSPDFGGVVAFASPAPSLSFTPGTDLGFSDAASPPSSFAQCTYAPAAGYDPLVRHLCLNPKGTLPPGAPDGQFTVQLRTRIH